jgi:hypothetical protein
MCTSTIILATAGSFKSCPNETGYLVQCPPYNSISGCYTVASFWAENFLFLKKYLSLRAPTHFYSTKLTLHTPCYKLYCYALYRKLRNLTILSHFSLTLRTGTNFLFVHQLLFQKECLNVRNTNDGYLVLHTSETKASHLQFSIILKDFFLSMVDALIFRNGGGGGEKPAL